MTKRYKITHFKHPHKGCTGELANDPRFPIRTFVYYAPMFALRLDEPSLGVSVVYVDEMDVEEIDDGKDND